MVTLELRSAEANQGGGSFPTKLSCQGSVLGVGLKLKLLRQKEAAPGEERERDAM